MQESRTVIFLAIFALMALQMLLSMVQVRKYQKTVRSMLGSGILGIGQRKGGLKSGEIIILSYDRGKDRVVCCKSMKGMTIFTSFRDMPEYAGMSLDEIRVKGVELDAKEMRRYRKKHAYDPKVLSKRKGAMIQAVEAIELRLSRESEKADGDGAVLADQA